jgi:Cu+-exporting ATPase
VESNVAGLTKLVSPLPNAMPDLTTTIAAAGEPGGVAAALVLAGTGAREAADRACFHCGTPLRGALFATQGKAFCCQGCLMVFELLAENGLSDFYKLGKAAGARPKTVPKTGEFDFLDDPAVRARLVDFADERITRATFRIPAMHCVACVWLLENLFRLNPGVGQSRVNFPRKEVFITFENAKTKLGELVALLASLGYAPDLKLSDLDNQARTPVSRRLWLQLGVAGFAFGNIMLMSVSSYFGLDAFSGPGLNRLFGYAAMALAIPVLVYSAADYWRAAGLALRARVLTIDVPIALGIAALAASSARDVVLGRGIGYFDSLAGLLFFLLTGKLFQQKTYDRLVFDRDYKSFFPLSITRKSGKAEERVSLSQLRVGDRLVIRNGELIPSDSRLVSGAAIIDYSFVTGESEPVEKKAGDHIYAGGRQTGGAIEIETVKAVSQSYLTSLWNQPIFRKEKGTAFETLTDQYSRRFTKIVLAIAIGAAIFWSVRDPARSLLSFISVLIVACPCALALAAPFTLGTAQWVLGRRKVFLRNASVIESLAKVDAVVFDKTGTLTSAGAGVDFHGEPPSREEENWIFSLTRHSTHPYAASISESLERGEPALETKLFSETPGCGVEGIVDGREIWLGSGTWLASRGVAVSAPPAATGSLVHAAIDGRYRGCYRLSSAIRPQTGALITTLSDGYELALLSGDNEKDRQRFHELFGNSGQLHFNQSPLDKLEFVRAQQKAGKTVMMVGDGLNDAGALRQSDVGVAVVESIGAFSPASDVTMPASMAPRLGEALRFSKDATRVVRICFAISSVYNAVGISLAARGLLSPVICAILMPVSSVTVAAFACGITTWLGRRAGLETGPNEESKP